MPRKSEEVLEALKALFVGAAPDADVARNQSKPARIGPGGAVRLRDGDPGEPDITLSPLTYTYEHRVEVEVGANESISLTSAQALDALLAALGDAIAADRTLGGLCEWVDASAPPTADAEQAGTQPFRWAAAEIVCVYSTTKPLG